MSHERIEFEILRTNSVVVNQVDVSHARVYHVDKAVAVDESDESGSSRQSVSHCWMQLPIMNAKLPQNVDITLS